MALLRKIAPYSFLVLVFFATTSVTTISSPKSGPNDTLSSLLKPISYNELVYLVDSLLDKEDITPADIALVNYYNTMLAKSKAINTGAMPAIDIYGDFDEENVFTITPENEFPEEQKICIVSDSLGKYAHPKCGPVNSGFGWRDGRMHKGIDIDLEKGQPVLAAFDGMVRVARRQGAYGNVVIIRHYNGLETVYAHLSKIKVKPGQKVEAGSLVGLGGSTGRSSGPHLHFEVRFKGQAINPANIISFSDNALIHDTITIRKSKYGIAGYPSNSTIYTVQRGDSWYEIAKRYGLTSKELMALNGSNSRFYLKVGQKLRIH